MLNSRTIRIALYSHDTMGLGHVRRNINLAWGFQKLDADIEILIISGSSRANNFLLPPRSQLFVLPSYQKELDGSYKSGIPGLSLLHLAKLRSQRIYSSLEDFRPNVFICDNVPRGLMNELDASLELLHKRRCFNILGLRDIRDEPVVTQSEWQDENYKQIVEQFYKRVWIYGDQWVYHLAHECNLPWRSQIVYTGYLNTHHRDIAPIGEKHPINDDYILCMVGGGQDGDAVIKSFVNAAFPDDCMGAVLTGPYLNSTERERIKRTAQHLPHVQIIDFVPETALLIKHARLVVSMGGYNSVMEILTHRKRSLIIPRVRPRLEQFIRAKRLQDLGLVDLLHPQHLDSDRISQWIHDNLHHSEIDTDGIDMDGIAYVNAQIMEIFNQIENNCHAQNTA